MNRMLSTCVIAWALGANAQSYDISGNTVTPEIVNIFNSEWSNDNLLPDSIYVEGPEKNNLEKNNKHKFNYSVFAELLSILYNSQVFQLFSNKPWWHIAGSLTSHLNKNTDFFVSSELYAAYDKNNQESVDHFTDIGCVFNHKWISLTWWFELDRYPKWTKDMNSFNVLWGVSYDDGKLNVSSVVFKPLITLGWDPVNGVRLSSTVSYNTPKIIAILRAWTVCHEKWKTQFAVWVHYLLWENILLKIESMPTWKIQVWIACTLWN